MWVVYGHRLADSLAASGGLSTNMCNNHVLIRQVNRYTILMYVKFLIRFSCRDWGEADKWHRLQTNVAPTAMILSGPNLGLRPANERRRYFVTTSLIGWAQAWNQPRYFDTDYLCQRRLCFHRRSSVLSVSRSANLVSIILSNIVQKVFAGIYWHNQDSSGMLKEVVDAICCIALVITVIPRKLAEIVSEIPPLYTGIRSDGNSLLQHNPKKTCTHSEFALCLCKISHRIYLCVLYIVLLRLYHQDSCDLSTVSLFLRVASLALGQFRDYPSASKVTNLKG